MKRDTLASFLEHKARQRVVERLSNFKGFGVGLILGAALLACVAARQLPVINAPIVVSTNEAAANSIVERDNNADAKAARWTSTTSMVSEGGIKADYESKTSSYTIVEADYLVAFNATGGAVTGTLPAAATSDGQIVTVKKTDSSINAVTVDGNASETIDGAANVILSWQYESATFMCDATGWHLLHRYIPRVSRAVNATETMTGAATVLLVTAAADVTITFPPAANWAGKSIWVKKVDAGAGDAIADGNAAETIDGAATTTTTIDTQYEAREFYSDGTSIQIVSASSPG